mmetsp:Transcript_11670/g.24674  ORF Transcript_11670/g.24674 Transcript_11670/m.24674 type:complete len:286 (+) Transcript_11670:3213-4070(+)
MPSLRVVLDKTIVAQNFSSTISSLTTTAFFAKVVGNVDLLPRGNGPGSRRVVEFTPFDFRIGVRPVSVAVIHVVVCRNHNGIVRSLDDHQCSLDGNIVVRISPTFAEPFIFDPTGWVAWPDRLRQDFVEKLLGAFGPGRRNLGVGLVVEVHNVGCVLRFCTQAQFLGNGSDRSTDHLRGRLFGIVRMEDHVPGNLDDIFSGLDGFRGVDAHGTGHIARDFTTQFQFGRDESILGSRNPVEDSLGLLEVCIARCGCCNRKKGCRPHQGQRRQAGKLHGWLYSFFPS